MAGRSGRRCRDPCLRLLERVPRDPHGLAGRLIFPSVGRYTWGGRPHPLRRRRGRGGRGTRGNRRRRLTCDRHGSGCSQLGRDGRDLRPNRRRFDSCDPRLDRCRRTRRLDLPRARLGAPLYITARRNRVDSRCGFGRRSRRHRLAGSGGVRNCRGGGLAGRRRRGRDARRQQGQRIDVALRIARHTGPEVHVRLRQFDDAARADGSHHRRFSHERPARHSDRPEVDKRGRIAKRRLDRHRLPAGRHRPGKGHHALRRREHGVAAGCAEVDAAVLAARVGVRVVEQERPQHRAVHGPRPGACT
jgi:hypothetical protein